MNAICMVVLEGGFKEGGVAELSKNKTRDRRKVYEQLLHDFHMIIT